MASAMLAVGSATELHPQPKGVYVYVYILSLTLGYIVEIQEVTRLNNCVGLERWLSG